MEHARKVRFAVVGLGHIAQVAVLPGFAHADDAELVAFFSDDPTKRAELGKKYDVEGLHGYESYDEVLDRGEIDAVYIALPNHLHADYTIRAAQRGVHVLVEKPMAIDERECFAMIAAAERHGVKLMVAYRLHFDPANLDAIAQVQKGRLGRPRCFVSTFTQNVVAGNVRLLPVAQGGGPVYDMGIYCINAARYLFRAEPTRVTAFACERDDERFRDAPEMVGALLEFPDDRLAHFTCSFGGADASRYEVIGDRGRLVMEPAYEYAEGLRYTIEVEGDKTAVERFAKHDQFGAELQYFSECVRENRPIEPDGHEGLADVRIIRAIHESAKTGAAVALPRSEKRDWPSETQAYALPGVRKPKTVHSQSPSGD
ncbi:MAG TPA: Gfo/Idh/MocA family oxidoreductase [Nannocystaceae bacterium]|nr:Gfo/Idh/MocA family oxidoreductase [Nannocystaceae bacterium]